MIAIAGVVDSTRAQQPAVSRVRGVIEKTLEGTLVVKARDGGDVEIQFDDKTTVIGLRKIELSDLPPEAFVGVAAVLGADGAQRAVSVHLFPEAPRGQNEGSRAYDLRPDSSMTNGTVTTRLKSSTAML